LEIPTIILISFGNPPLIYIVLPDKLIQKSKN